MEALLLCVPAVAVFGFAEHLGIRLHMFFQPASDKLILNMYQILRDQSQSRQTGSVWKPMVARVGMVVHTDGVMLLLLV
jgi:hypothetical protein